MDKRTNQQNRALHKYFDLLAKELNDAGWPFWKVMLRGPAQAIKELRDEANPVAGDYYDGILYAVETIEDAMPKSDMGWTARTVKEHIWRTTQIHVLGKESTADADTVDYTKVYEYVNRITAESFGVSVPWPVREDG